MAMLSSFRTWLGRKQVQLEVTFSVYMFTPWEKFAFCKKPRPRCPPAWLRGERADQQHTDSIVFLLFSLTFIAAILYLPHHVAILAGRAWYYINGENIDVAASAREVVKDMTSSVLQERIPTVTKEAVVETIVKEL